MNDLASKRVPTCWVTLVICALALGSGRTTGAQDLKAEAKKHFDSGVTAVKANRLADGLREFELAYRLSPAFQVLYNIAEVNAALQRHAAAARAFRQYLDDGGASLSIARRAQVAAELAAEHAFLGSLDIKIRPDGASLIVDGSAAGPGLSEHRLWLEPGPHIVQASLPGYLTQSRTFALVAGMNSAMELVLTPLPAPSEQHPDKAPTALPVARPQTVAYVSGIGGAAIVSTGVVLALTGANEANRAYDRMAAAPTASAWDIAKNDYDTGSIRNEIGLILMGVGAASVGVSVFLFATRRPAGVDVSMNVAPQGVSVRGSW